MKLKDVLNGSYFVIIDDTRKSNIYRRFNGEGYLVVSGPRGIKPQPVLKCWNTKVQLIIYPPDEY